MNMGVKCAPRRLKQISQLKYSLGFGLGHLLLKVEWLGEEKNKKAAECMRCRRLSKDLKTRDLSVIIGKWNDLTLILTLRDTILYLEKYTEYP